MRGWTCWTFRDIKDKVFNFAELQYFQIPISSLEQQMRLQYSLKYKK